jgi:hypothetical protein
VLAGTARLGAAPVIFTSEELWQSALNGEAVIGFEGLAGVNRSVVFSSSGLLISTTEGTVRFRARASGSIGAYNYPGNPVLTLGTGAVLVGPVASHVPQNRIDIELPAGRNAAGLLLNAVKDDFTATGGRAKVRFVAAGSKVLHDEEIGITAPKWTFRAVAAEEPIAFVEIYGISSTPGTFVRPTIDNFSIATYTPVTATPEPALHFLFLGVGLIAISLRR